MMKDLCGERVGAGIGAGIGTGTDTDTCADERGIRLWAKPVRIIPCLDVKDGRVVKGVRFSGLRDAGDPVEMAAVYQAQGADELVMLDISATEEGRGNKVEIVRQIRKVISIPLTVGGGVRSVEDMDVLLQAGADKVSLNSAPLKKPELLATIAGQFGRERTVLAIDAALFAAAVDNPINAGGPWEALACSGHVRTGLDAVEFARLGAQLGAGEILLTSWDRDGLTDGYDLQLIRAVAEAVDVPVIASGGAGNPTHLHEGLMAGASAVLAASIFHHGDYTVTQLKKWLADRGVPVRLPSGI